MDSSLHPEAMPNAVTQNLQINLNYRILMESSKLQVCLKISRCAQGLKLSYQVIRIQKIFVNCLLTIAWGVYEDIQVRACSSP